jgi:transposase InsO family protein
VVQALQEALGRFPFEVKGLQIDGGSEYKGDFEPACQELGLKLFVLPPRSPKLNGRVERSHRTHQEEYYEVTDAEPEIASLRQELAQWEKVYNEVRPHQALGYLTPKEFLEQNGLYQPKIIIQTKIQGGVR